jgi:hypothetical protein
MAYLEVNLNLLVSVAVDELKDLLKSGDLSTGVNLGLLVVGELLGTTVEGLSALDMPRILS